MTDTVIGFLSNTDPNITGEALRNVFWPKMRKTDIGGYNNFNYDSIVYDIQVIPETNEDSELNLAKVKVDGVEVSVCWYWDGDGYIEFTWEYAGRNYKLINDDCKKTYNWYWY